MKRIHIALLAGVAGMATMSSAALADGAYFSFGGGFSLPQDSQVDVRRPPGAGRRSPMFPPVSLLSTLK